MADRSTKSTTGVSNLKPAGQIQPVTAFNNAPLIIVFHKHLYSCKSIVATRLVNIIASFGQHIQ